MRWWFLLYFLCVSGCARPVRVGEGALSQEVDLSANSAARAWYLKALTAENRGDIAQAEYSIGWAVRMNRNNPWIHVSLGRFLERNGDDEAAIQAYHNALEITELSEAYEALGRIYLARSEWDLGIKALRQARSEAAYARLADYFRDQDDREQVAMVLDAWSRLPASLTWVNKRTDLASWLGKESQFWADYFLLLGHAPSHETAERALISARPACQQGSVWWWSKKHGVSQRDSRWRAFALGAAESVGDVQTQEEILRSQLERDESYRLWEYLKRERRFLELLESVERFEDRQTTPSALAGLMKGVALSGLHRYDEAIYQWDRALRDEPLDEGLATALVDLRLAQGNQREALEVIRQFREATGDADVAVQLHARWVALSGDRDRANGMLVALPSRRRLSAGIDIALAEGDLEAAGTFALEMRDAATLERVVEWASERGRLVEIVEELLLLQELAPDSRASGYLVTLGHLSAQDALEISPCDPALIRQFWESAENCDDLEVLRRGYTGYPADFSILYSAASLRCHEFEEAEEAARHALEIEDSAASRRHLDYVLKTAGQHERARRKP